MSLSKISVILLVTWGFNASITPPNPPPPKHERITSRVPMEDPRFTQWVPVLMKVLQVVVAISEIATILASATPSSSFSKTILSLLVWGHGEPDNIRMSSVTALGLMLMVFGTWIRMLTYYHLGQFFRFEASIQQDHKLIVSGPYAVVRHPSYTGLMMVFIGWFPWQLGKGSWVMESGFWDTTLGRTFIVTYIGLILFPVSYLVLERMSKEDKALRKHFGTEWDKWAEKVPYSIFPGIY